MAEPSAPGEGTVSPRPYWWGEADLAEPEDPPAVPENIDVAVIGGGLTGLSAARTLAKRGASVAVLEHRAMGFGASTRNGGMIGNGHRLGVVDAQRKYGADIGQGLIDEANAAFDFATGVIDEEKIDCDFARHGRLMATWSRRDYDNLARTVDVLQRAGADDVVLVSRQDMAQEIDTPLYQGGCLYKNHGGLNPFKYHCGFMEAAARHGAVLCPHTPVLKLDREKGGFRLATPRGEIRASRVIVATNGYTGSLVDRLTRRLIPVPSFIIATEDIGENRARSLMPGGRMMVETRAKHGYYRLSPDGRRVLIGGRAALLDIAPEKAVARMRRLMTEIFPDLADVRLTHSWRGKLGFTFNGLPSVGAVDDIYYAVGFNGSGNAMAPYLGHKAALQTLGDPDGATVFSRTPFPGRFYHRGHAGTTPWFMPIANAQWRTKDWWDDRRR